MDYNQFVGLSFGWKFKLTGSRWKWCWKHQLDLSCIRTAASTLSRGSFDSDTDSAYLLTMILVLPSFCSAAYDAGASLGAPVADLLSSRN